MSSTTNVQPFGVQYNTCIFRFYQTFFVVAGGCITGIWGLTNLKGFLMYPISNIFLFLAIYLKTKGNPFIYFMESIPSLYIRCLFSKDGFLSFILFWTLFYSITYIKYF
ncbi:hypothetical protein GpartN1_g4411.t1 [Galdieria partita]|uniref:ER membrane protein complex subunit 6 n=1 Tax=Galdieria partita TaxID=83374 RepID=A0A9C7PY89_9RHOD|nr:hypothetical protein GpartN1_g4411.t1 [Galdieria partita]